MIPNPLALIAEITHRCPLHCVYCSNPLQMVAAKTELATAEWIRVFEEASRLGIVHLHLTGGEPVSWGSPPVMQSRLKRPALWSLRLHAAARSHRECHPMLRSPQEFQVSISLNINPPATSFLLCPAEAPFG